MTGDYRVVGLDLSLAGTGVAVVEYGPRQTRPSDEDGGKWRIHTFRIPTRKRTGDLNDLLTRMRWVRINAAIAVEHADLVVVEGMAYAAHDTGRAGAGTWWLTVERVIQDAPVLVVPPATLKKFATGKGNSDKHAVTTAVARMWPDHETKSADEGDALALASLGAALLDLPVPFDLPQYRRAVIDGLSVPDIEETAA